MKKFNCLRIALFIVALLLIEVCLPQSASAAEPKRLNLSPPPYWFFAGIDARVDNLSITVNMSDADGKPVTDALIMLNHYFLHFTPANSSYYFATGQVHISMGMQFDLRVWLNDPKAPFVDKQVPGRLPDISGTGAISNWLTPVFPVHKSGIRLAPNSSPTFTWAFAGGMETTCVYLYGPLTSGASTIFNDECVPQPSIMIPQGKLVQGTYAMLYRVAFPFPLRSNLSLKPGSYASFKYVTYVEFAVGPPLAP
jgi:hypothetical protein